MLYFMDLEKCNWKKNAIEIHVEPRVAKVILRRENTTGILECLPSNYTAGLDYKESLVLT